MLCLTVEFVNFFRLSRYNPTDIRNRNEKTRGFRDILCEMGDKCKFTSLHHHLMFHCLTSPCGGNPEVIDGEIKQSFIAFYQTTEKEALEIAVKGVPLGDNGEIEVKDSPLKGNGDIEGANGYTRLKKSIYFTRACSIDFETSEAIICVRLSLGRVKKLSIIGDGILKTNYQSGVGECDTLYLTNEGRIYIRMPAQIEKWIIVFNDKVNVNDKIDRDAYKYCV